MPPPPAETIASRIFLGPALRAQPDKRLVTLVREGYETAFEEIVRRYGKPLGRYAAAIVGGRAEDVTQEAFSKALPALRRNDGEIELRPWLYRIVRNTALNDLRDHPPSPEALDEAIEGGLSVEEAAERREEIDELMTRLQALPEAQRAAIVMRELEGLSHDEIAAALGVSGGAARQVIYRARVALRGGVGMLLPLPLLRLLIDHGTEAAAAGGATAAAGGVFGLGAGTAMKAGVVTVVLAGSVGTGIALNENRDHGSDSAVAAGTTAGAAASTSTPANDEGGAGSDSSRANHGQSGPGNGQGRDDDAENGRAGVTSGQNLTSARGGPNSGGGHGPRGESHSGPPGDGPGDRGGRHSAGPQPHHHGPGHGPGGGRSPGGGGPGAGSGEPSGGGGPRHGPGGGGHGSRTPMPPLPNEPTPTRPEGEEPTGSGEGSGSMSGPPPSGAGGRGGDDQEFP